MRQWALCSCHHHSSLPQSAVPTLQRGAAEGACAAAGAEAKGACSHAEPRSIHLQTHIAQNKHACVSWPPWRAEQSALSYSSQQGGGLTSLTGRQVGTLLIYKQKADTASEAVPKGSGVAAPGEGRALGLPHRHMGVMPPGGRSRGDLVPHGKEWLEPGQNMRHAGH